MGVHISDNDAFVRSPCNQQLSDGHHSHNYGESQQTGNNTAPGDDYNEQKLAFKHDNPSEMGKRLLSNVHRNHHQVGDGVTGDHAEIARIEDKPKFQKAESIFTQHEPLQVGDDIKKTVQQPAGLRTNQDSEGGDDRADDSQTGIKRIDGAKLSIEDIKFEQIMESVNEREHEEDDITTIQYERFQYNSIQSEQLLTDLIHEHSTSTCQNPRQHVGNGQPTADGDRKMPESDIKEGASVVMKGAKVLYDIKESGQSTSISPQGSTNSCAANANTLSCSDSIDVIGRVASRNSLASLIRNSINSNQDGDHDEYKGGVTMLKNLLKRHGGPLLVTKAMKRKIAIVTTAATALASKPSPRHST